MVEVVTNAMTNGARILDQAQVVRLLSEPLPPVGLTRRVFDAQISRLALRISPQGAATFCLLYQFHGKARSYRIGRFRTDADAKKATGDRGLTARQARAEAIRLNVLIDAGQDIAGTRSLQRENAKAADANKKAEAAARVTVEQAFERYRADIATRAKKLRPSTILSIEKSFRLHVLPRLGQHQVRELTADQVREMHRSVTKGAKGKHGRRTGGRIAANRAVDYLSGMLSWCADEGWVAVNVARRNKERHAEEGRERYLTEVEWTAVERTLDAWPFKQFVPVGPRVKGRQVEERQLKKANLGTYLSCEAIRMFLLTGCRKGEALGARWDQIDLEAGVWTKPASSTKQKKLHRLPLSRRMIAKLREIRAHHTDPIFVFPGKIRLASLEAGRSPKSGGSLTDVSGLWRPMRARLGLDDVRLHDLRHSHASALVNSGVDLYTASKALGHSTIKTTEKYAHLQDDAVRDAVNLVGARSAKAAKSAGTPSTKVSASN
jgi:integrase